MAARARATVTETQASHAVYVSKAKDVAALIERAAREVNGSGRSLTAGTISGNGQTTQPCIESFRWCS